jgi:hypothetical protein
VANLKSQLHQLQIANQQDSLIIERMQIEVQTLEGILKRMQELEMENLHY